MMANLIAYREGDRSFPILWPIRVFGLVVTIITLGLSAASTASFSNLSCGTPGKLSFNVAVVCVYFFFLLRPIVSRPLRLHCLS